MQKKVIVLSEFGLELADKVSLYRKLKPFIESHSWRLPLIYTGLYLQGQREEFNEDTSLQEVSRFFARATLEIIGKIYGFFENTANYTKYDLTRKNIEELQVALAFQVLAFDREILQRAVSELQDKLSSLIEKIEICDNITIHIIPPAIIKIKNDVLYEKLNLSK